jgi:uncharacterized protein YbdZ (MbtH family)
MNRDDAVTGSTADDRRTSSAGDDSLYAVIANCEDELAIWPTSRPAPPAWRPTGYVGVLETCLAWIAFIDATKNSGALRQLVEWGVRRP